MTQDNSMIAYKYKSPVRKNKKSKMRYQINQSFTFAPQKVYVQDPNPGWDPFESSQAAERSKNEEQKQLNKLIKYKVMEIEDYALLAEKD